VTLDGTIDSKSLKSFVEGTLSGNGNFKKVAGNPSFTQSPPKEDL